MNGGGETVTCLRGCTRPALPVLCDPAYAGHGEGTHPYATGRFRCPACGTGHTPELGGGQRS